MPVVSAKLRLALVAIVLAGCGESAPSPPAPRGDRPQTSRGDATRGRALLTEHECNRCHEGVSAASPPQDRQCVGCHRAIAGGVFEGASAETIARWNETLHSLPAAPHLANAVRLRRAWVAEFLQAPTDQRPGLEATMPRFDLDEEQAWDIAAALGTDPSEASPRTGDTAPRTLEEHGCRVCHRTGGGAIADGSSGEGAAELVALAPDLALSADRMSRAMIERWLSDPRSVSEHAAMPAQNLSPDEVRAIADALFQLDEPPRASIPARLPVLEREVTFEEIDGRIFRRVCWHCHSDPDFARGDGGPGNSGGFGFIGRRIDLSSYPAIRSGGLDDTGERASLFREVELESETMPLIVAVLRARQYEEAGRRLDALPRGMPMGFPSIPPEDIQLLETWIAQGRRPPEP